VVGDYADPVARGSKLHRLIMMFWHILVVARYLKIKKHILQPGPGSNVVDYKWALVVSTHLIGHYAYMRNIAGQHPRNNFTCSIITCVIGYGEFLAFPLEKNLQIWNSSMVNIGVGFR